jgi:hypothetical protein
MLDTESFAELLRLFHSLPEALHPPFSDLLCQLPAPESLEPEPK